MSTASKLKSLKVAELKDILSNANVHFATKATKSDLISKIIASPVALNLFNNPQPQQNDDLVRPSKHSTYPISNSSTTLQLAPPEESVFFHLNNIHVFLC
jgi:SAP domain-containing ribonucleoprotein